MKNPRRLLIAAIVVGVLSFVAFFLERLALTDIFHGEADVHLEWSVVSAAFLPIAFFHVLAIVSLAVALRRLGRRDNPPEN